MMEAHENNNSENGKMNDLPDWAKEMSDEEWDKEKQDKDYGMANCEVCNARLLLTMCDHSESKHYCYNHCPQHLWQTTYDWPVECARCAINYTAYLEDVLDKHSVNFNNRHWKELS